MPIHPARPRPASLHTGARYLLCLPPQPPLPAACLVVTLLSQAPCPAVVIVADDHHHRFPVDRRCLYALAEPTPSPPPGTQNPGSMPGAPG